MLWEPNVLSNDPSSRRVYCKDSRNGGRKTTKKQNKHLLSVFTWEQSGLPVRGDVSVTEKAMWPFYKVCLLNEGFGDERDDTNTCMLHVHPPGPPSGTVTCILEVLPPPWKLCLFLGPFLFDELSERTIFLFFFYFFLFVCFYIRKMWTLMEDFGCEVRRFFHTLDPLLLETELVDGHQRRTLLTMPSFRRHRVRGRLRFRCLWIHMYKRRSTFCLCYHPRKLVWFPVTIPADILQWFKEARR